MKAEDLRIGNIIGINHEKYPGQTIEKEADCTILNIMSGYIPVPENMIGIEFVPIPLTWYHLKSHGALQSLTEQIGTYLYSRFKLVWREEYNYWYVTDAVEQTYMTKIEFVHEWQNFVRWTDGVELKIDVK